MLSGGQRSFGLSVQMFIGAYRLFKYDDTDIASDHTTFIFKWRSPLDTMVAKTQAYWKCQVNTIKAWFNVTLWTWKKTWHTWHDLFVKWWTFHKHGQCISACQRCYGASFLLPLSSLIWNFSLIHRRIQLLLVMLIVFLYTSLKHSTSLQEKIVKNTVVKKEEDLSVTPSIFRVRTVREGENMRMNRFVLLQRSIMSSDPAGTLQQKLRSLLSFLLSSYILLFRQVLICASKQISVAFGHRPPL